MTDRDRELASNALDALDRLYDRDARAVDVQALVEATADAVTPGELADVLREAAIQLSEVLSAGLSLDDQNERALVATDELRHLLADVWSTTAEADAFVRRPERRVE